MVQAAKTSAMDAMSRRILEITRNEEPSINEAQALKKIRRLPRTGSILEV